MITETCWKCAGTGIHDDIACCRCSGAGKYQIFEPKDVKLKKDDHVVMHTCAEVMFYYGRIWKCKGDEYTMCQQQVVMLEGFSGAFHVGYLQKVNIEQFKEQS